MPRKNAIREYGEDEYYHVYNRGANKMDIFRDQEDFVFMLSLFRQYLSTKTAVDNYGREKKNYADQIDLVGYCLMPNHYHLLVYLKEAKGLELLMRSVMTTYSMYFNRKYKHSGTVFEGNFLAARITTDEYLWQVSRYIHLNPIDVGKSFTGYPYSSFEYYTGEKQAGWLKVGRLVEEGEARDYEAFVLAGVEYHAEYKKLRKLNLLANG